MTSTEKLGVTGFFFFLYILFCQYEKKRRGLISYCAGIANISIVCLKILLNLYKKERKFIIVFLLKLVLFLKSSIL